MASRFLRCGIGKLAAAGCLQIGMKPYPSLLPSSVELETGEELPILDLVVAGLEDRKSVV